jgi:gamma-glutamyltranspeptidase / glutathione hydrolase
MIHKPNNRAIKTRKDLFVKICVFVALWFFLLPTQYQAASRISARARNGMVASTSEIAARVGVDVMQKGGNAVDAAVAVGLALAVTWPEAGNLGGAGFMIIRKEDGTTEIIDYRELAPIAATKDMFLDSKGEVIPNASVSGYKSIAVPGTVAGLSLALKHHGTWSWQQVVEPAYRLASEGFIINYITAKRILAEKELLNSFPESKRIFLRNGNYYQEGDRFIQTELAETLKRLKEKGPREFYEGEMARRITAEIQANGGIITEQDMKEYQPKLRKPLMGTYRGYQILTMPPPSSGGPALLEMLNILENFELKNLPHNSSEELHLLVETMKLAFADRSEFIGDPDFTSIPVERLISKEYAKQLAAQIDLKKSIPSESIHPRNVMPVESDHTTHFSIIDREGNIVLNTYTLNAFFGSGVTIRGTGVLMNDGMDDFTSNPGTPNIWGLLQSDANAIEPRKRPVSSMTPTMVLKDQQPYFALGSPGGGTIPNTVLQVILNVVDYNMDLQQAIEAPDAG